MQKTAMEVVDLLRQREAFLSECEEYLAEREYVICVDAWVKTGELKVPLCLQHYNTQIIETFNSDWHDPDALTKTILPYLENICEYWENVHHAHQTALDIFHSAADEGKGYCLYLRSFAHVFLTDINMPMGRAVMYQNTESLDRNVAHALLTADTLNSVSCLHPDDMALLEGKWLLPAFRVHDHDWKVVLSEAISVSKLMVFYLGDSSDGAEFELEEIRRARLEHRTIIVYEKKDNIPDDVAKFAEAFSISEFVMADNDPLRARLTSKAKMRLSQLASDGYKPPQPADWLCELPCNVVDPKVPIDLPSDIDPANTFCLTPENLTAFTWYMVGLPDAMLCWNKINRKLYYEKRAPEIADVNELLSNVIMACLGSASLGLTSSLSAAIGLRVIAANLIQVPETRLRMQRKKELLRALDIGDRLDNLTSKHRWRLQNNEWREIIRDEHFS